MGKVGIYSVSDNYISFLRSDPRLKNVFENKDPNYTYSRKYLGIVFSKSGFNYFIPFSSPKDSDYITSSSGERKIRRSIIPIIRMTHKKGNIVELKGTLKLSNMIPIPETELTPYDTSLETDASYRDLIYKEWSFITSNLTTILNYADVIYNQKTKQNILYAEMPAPNYLLSTVDFLYAETKCQEYIDSHTK